MFFLQRALIFIWREKIRNALFFLLVFILGSFIMGIVVAREGLTTLETNIVASLGGRVAIENSQGDGAEKSQSVISAADLNKISQDSSVKSFEYNIYSTVESTVVQKVGNGVDVDSRVNSLLAPQFLVQGVQIPETAEIQLNVNQLIAGRSFTETEITNGATVALVSDALADQNGWAIGETISFDNNVYPIEVYTSGKNDEEQIVPTPLMSSQISVEIIGLYRPPLREPPKEAFLAGKNESIELANNKKINTIFVPNKISEGINAYKTENSNQASNIHLSNILFLLESPEDLTRFISENEDKLPPGYRFVSNVEVSNVVLQSVDMIKELLTLVLYISLVGSLLITYFVIMLFLKNRKREIALYMALGEKKINIIGQFLVEISIVVMLALIFSFSLTGLFNNVITEKIIFNQLIVQEEREYEKILNGEVRENVNPLLSKSVATADAEALYKVSVDYMLVIQTLLFGLFLIISTTGVTAYVILKQDPKTMLEAID